MTPTPPRDQITVDSYRDNPVHKAIGDQIMAFYGYDPKRVFLAEVNEADVVVWSHFRIDLIPVYWDGEGLATLPIRRRHPLPGRRQAA